MLSSVLRSERAVLVNIEIMRAFVRIRRMMIEHKDLSRRLDALEARYDGQLKIVFKAIRRLYPDYDLWRDFAYEYVFDKMAIDVINGSPLLREWVDDAEAAPSDLDALTIPDERAWEEEREDFLLY